jgi:hypothetical protein
MRIVNLVQFVQVIGNRTALKYCGNNRFGVIRQ